MTTSFVVIDMSAYAGVIYFPFINLFVILSSVLLINLIHGFIFVVCKFLHFVPLVVRYLSLLRSPQHVN